MTTDEQGEYLAAWLAAHPTSPLKDWEQRAHDRAMDVPDWMQVRAEIQRSGEHY